jgi:hypothetical protein
MSPVNRSRSTSPADSISSGIGLAPYTYTHGGGGFALHESHLVDTAAPSADRYTPRSHVSSTSSSPAPASQQHDANHFLHPGRRATLHSGATSGFEPMETESTPSKQRSSNQQQQKGASPCVHAAVWTIMAAVVVAALIAVALVGQRWVGHAAKHDGASGAPPPLTAAAMNVKATILPDAVHAAVTKHLVNDHLGASKTTPPNQKAPPAVAKVAAVAAAHTLKTLSPKSAPAAKAALSAATATATRGATTVAKKKKAIKSAKPIKMTTLIEPKKATATAKMPFPASVAASAIAKATTALPARVNKSKKVKRAQTATVAKKATLQVSAPAIKKSTAAAPTIKKSIARKLVEKHVIKSKAAPAVVAKTNTKVSKSAATAQQEQKVQLSNPITELTADHIMDELAAQRTDPGMIIVPCGFSSRFCTSTCNIGD